MADSPLLSIIIPTRNRTTFLINTVKNLLELSKNLFIEIIVSDNSDVPNQEILNIGNNVRYVRPQKVLDTAEENLFYAFSFATGKYVWPLGDDDVVLKHGFENLVKECQSGHYDVMTWNASNVTSKYQPMGWSRVYSHKDKLEISYRNFLERMGYWSIPAGISLTVFKKTLLDFEVLKTILELKSKIYSHVTYYACIFNNSNFAFINNDLVKYRTNTYDVQDKTTDHWVKYSEKLGFFDRYFWTKGFIEHLVFLQNKGILDSDYLSKAIDIGHFNNRLPLLEHIISLTIDQLEKEIYGYARIPAKIDEVRFIVDYLSRNAPEYRQLLDDILLYFDKKNKKTKINKNEFANFKSDWDLYMQRYPFHRFYRAVINGRFVYETPLGWLALIQKTTKSKFGVPQIESLDAMLRGVDFPRVENILTDDTYEGLSKKILVLQLTERDIDANLSFHTLPEIYQHQNRLKVQSNLGKIFLQSRLMTAVWRFLPVGLRLKIRARLMS